MALACAWGCGDDGGGDDGIDIGRKDGGDAGERDAGRDGGRPPMGRPDSGRDEMDAKAADSGDSGFDPFDYDATYQDAEMNIPPAPEAWSCAEALWADGVCDCGCGAADYDCSQFSCTEPGCIPEGPNGCQACFGTLGTWNDCSGEPDSADWTCTEAQLGDELCDCGCGIPDPSCMGRGCTEPGCRKDACDRRHGCEEAAARGVLDPKDQCDKNPAVFFGGSAFSCAWDHYGSGDGCDCGCTVRDPDCAANSGCVGPRCYEESCELCHDQNGSPYPCTVAGAGWDDDTLEAVDGFQTSQCLAAHFGTGDGCDCGCGGIDPDCGDEGCTEPGCFDAACTRCTDPQTLEPTGCAPDEWLEAGCNPAAYGTGDGCDCGCGVDDPDCDGAGCTGASCQDEACDVCNDGEGGFTTCPNWTCGSTTDERWTQARCDCGCGVVDPYCREFSRVSCTEPGCETALCEYCNDNAGGAACGGQWTCDPSSFGLDGLCDCGCGAADPDCGEGLGCSERGCFAAGCEVCHRGSITNACYAWTCAAKDDPNDWVGFGAGDGCDCGCGLADPDCEGGGCSEAGCTDASCEICHDPFGRTVPCVGQQQQTD